MIHRRILRFTTILLLCLSSCAVALAQTKGNSARAKKQMEEMLAGKQPVLGGIMVHADLIGLAQSLMGSKFSNMECGGKVNFLNRYFPTVELGIGHGHREGQDLDNTFSTTAPYIRVGGDYNFGKVYNTNRILAGVRYGWTSFNYDYTTGGFSDPVWGGSQTLELKDQDGRAHWLEFVIGVQTKLWSFIHMGWDIRFKARVKQKTSPYGEPWYIPGYGRNSSTMWGGNVKLVFDIATKWNKKNKKRKASPKPTSTTITPVATDSTTQEAPRQTTTAVKL